MVFIELYSLLRAVRQVRRCGGCKVSVGLVKRVVGGVAARKTILLRLLEGPQTGLLLRAAIARKVSKAVDEVSDAMLYFNLQHLENHGLIERFRDGKEKAARIVPHRVQSVRRFLEVEAPFVYMGGIGEDPGVLTSVPKRLRSESSIRPKRFHYFIDEASRRRLSGLTPDREIHEVPSSIFNDDLEQMYKLVLNLATKLIWEHTILVDVSGGGKVCALALYRLAFKFDLPCFYVTEMGSLTWLQH